MNKYFNGLYSIHLELTSLCNKNCWMCGRRKIDRDYPNIKMNYGHMDIGLVAHIAKQLPDNIVVQFHNNGEPLLYPNLKGALQLYSRQIRCLDTNGKLLLEKADEVIDILDTITISVIENDPEGDEQYNIVNKFLKIKGNRKPLMIYRLLGDITKKPVIKYGKFPDVDYIEERKERWYKLPGIVATRTLHSPMGSRNYEKPVTIPEIGICVEAITHLAINRLGEVSMCVRFDPERKGVIGNVNDTPLIDIWNGIERQTRLIMHKEGRRLEIPLCDKCHYWGVPIR